MKYAEFKERMHKSAGIYSDLVKGTVGGSVASTIPVIGPVAGAASMAGPIAAYADDDTKYEGNYTGNQNFVPGLSSYNITKQRIKALKDYGAESPKALEASEAYGAVPSTLLAALILGAAGAGVGYAATREPLGALEGAGIGAAASTIPNMIAPLAALIKKTKTKSEQEAYAKDPKSVAKNLLIPGRAMYNYYKTIGRIHADQNAAEKQNG